VRLDRLATLGTVWEFEAALYPDLSEWDIDFFRIHSSQLFRNALPVIRSKRFIETVAVTHFEASNHC
jgi:hypothetical protein